MIHYEEEWLLPLIFKLDGSVYCRSVFWSLPPSLLSMLFVWFDYQYPDLAEDVTWARATASQIWSAATLVLLLLLGFRSRNAYNRFWEGTGLLHQMKGEWFDTVSNCISFTLASVTTKREQVQAFRHTIVRLMSLCHGSALEEISGMESSMDTIDTMGLSNATLRHLKDCVETYGFNKVEVLLHLLQTCITKAHTDGIIPIPPPILSRVYQTISRGYVNLLNTKKITDTKFPFPFVQLIVALLLVHVLLTPMVVAHNLPSLILAPLLTFLFLFGAFAVNFVAVELEDPFGEDSNDLPLMDFQAEMNNCLMMLLHPNTDVVAGIEASRCITDFQLLQEMTNTTAQVMGDLRSDAPESRAHRSCHHVEVDIDLLDGSAGGDAIEEAMNNGSFTISGRKPSVRYRSTQSGQSAGGSRESKGPASGTPSPPMSPKSPSAPQVQWSPPAGPPPAALAAPPPAPQTPGGRSASDVGKEASERRSGPCKDLLSPPLRRPGGATPAQQVLAQRMEEVSSRLQGWTAAIDAQVREVTERLSFCSELSEALLVPPAEARTASLPTIGSSATRKIEPVFLDSAALPRTGTSTT